MDDAGPRRLIQALEVCTYRVIRINFVVAVWLTVVTGVVALATLHPSTYLQEHPGSQAPIGAALLVLYEVAMWFYAFKDDEGRGAAARVGLVLAGPAVALVFIPQVTDLRFDWLGFLYFSYLSVSHFTYAIANWNRHNKSWLD